VAPKLSKIILPNFNKENKIMINNIKELLQNAQLQQQVKASANLSEAIKLITTAGAQKGYSFTQQNVAQAIRGLMLGEQELSEDDLLAVAGGAVCRQSCVESNTFVSPSPNC
jgi:predicted ribosomally synthesized peptide with nif11-like leader